MFNRAKRSPNNDLDSISFTLCKQRGSGSNPLTPTKFNIHPGN